MVKAKRDAYHFNASFSLGANARWIIPFYTWRKVDIYAKGSGVHANAFCLADDLRVVRRSNRVSGQRLGGIFNPWPGQELGHEF
jgi:hypothetical protein